MFNTINDALNYLYSKRNKYKDNNRIKRCISKLNININYKIILITGTNGKGSTALFIKNILKNTMHVGIFTSPFVTRFNERIMINDRQISDAEIMHYLNILEDLSNWYLKEYNDIIPFFELTLLMSLLYYQDREIDLGVFECGIGGLNDSCNQLEPDLSIITSIGYDHMDVLGNTLEDILKNKLGIVRLNKPLIYSNCNKELDNIYNEYINKYNLKAINVYNDVKIINEFPNLEFSYKSNNYKLKMKGIHQAYNASIAIEAINTLFNNYPNIFIEEGLNNSILAARLEIINNNPLEILDGAHNIDAIKNTIDYVSKIKKDKKLITVFNALSNKSYDKMLNELEKITDLFIFIEFKDERKTDINLFINSINKDYKIINDIKELDEYKNSNNIILYTGSLHFASFIKNIK